MKAAMVKAPVLILLCTMAFVAGARALAPVKHKPKTATSIPLTYNNVVSYFKETGLPTTEVQKRCTIFFEGEFRDANVYNYCLIIVENSDADVQVTFYLTDAHEMIWVNEFIDSPFFSSAEAEKLFRLSQSRRDVRGESVGRFQVDFHKWEPRHAQILVFSFTKH